MIRHISALMALALGAGPVMAQTVMRPDPPLDSARASVRDALLILRDSLNTIEGAAARLQRDFRQASGPSLVSRARVMHLACSHSKQVVPPTRHSVLDAQLAEPSRVRYRAALIQEMDRLSKALSRCELDFAAMSKPGEGETVRGYGNDRATKVQAALRRYEVALRSFLGVMGIKVMPIGSTPPAAAG